MEQVNFIEQLKELIAAEDLRTVSKSVNELKSKFEDYVLEEERKVQIMQIESVEKGDNVAELENDFGKEMFYSLYNDYKERKKKIVDEIQAVEARNLLEKNALIEKLRNVVTKEENIGAAFASFKEIQDKWKEIGDIPRDKRSEVQAEYSRLLEDFFYNIKIYKELKDHDFHRNQQLKEEVIKKLKELNQIKSVKEVEQQLKALQNDWEDIGPVHNEEWEKLKDAYWTEVRSVYDRVNRFYEDRRTQQLENLKEKEALLGIATNLTQDLSGLDSSKLWDEKTQELIELQQKWKSVGFGPKKENDKVWKDFRSVCDSFFDAKKLFFDKVHEEFDGIADEKKKLIEQAINFKDSTDWIDASNQLIRLQKEWKKLGHAGKKHEQKLWRKFRSLCDEFFERRQNHFKEMDLQFEGNLAQKLELLKEIEHYSVSEDHKKVLENLKEFTNRFNAIGKVPQKNQQEIYQSFKNVMDKHYGAIRLEGADKEKVMFEVKLDTLKSSPDANRLLSETKFELRKEIDKLQKEISQLENNLGFFANSKGADSLKKEVEKKIDRAKEKVQMNKAKIKLIPNE